jgi:hypothetical protein
LQTPNPQDFLKNSLPCYSNPFRQSKKAERCPQTSRVLPQLGHSCYGLHSPKRLHSKPGPGLRHRPAVISVHVQSVSYRLVRYAGNHYGRGRRAISARTDRRRMAIGVCLRSSALCMGGSWVWEWGGFCGEMCGNSCGIFRFYNKSFTFHPKSHTQDPPMPFGPERCLLRQRLLRLESHRCWCQPFKAWFLIHCFN